MKDYPSIIRMPDSGDNNEYYTFFKYDGTQIRSEFSNKTGWYKFGTRKRLIDKNEPIFGKAIDIFMEQWSEPLTKTIRDNKIKGNVVIFSEFFGPNSFAGSHIDEEKVLKPFDVAIHKRGILGPKEFLKLFGHLDIAEFVGIFKWNKEFVQRVRISDIEGITYEGCVGKRGNGHDLTMVKAKTQKWLDAVRERYSETEANLLINS